MATVTISALPEDTTPSDGSLLETASTSGSGFASRRMTFSTFANYLIGKVTAVIGSAWTPYAPTVTSGSGTFTSIASSGRYKRIGKTVFVQIRVAITTNGTAGASIVATLPFNAASTGLSPDGWVLSGRETLNSRMAQGFILSGGTVVTMLVYNNTYPGGDNQTLYMSGVYETSAA